MNKKNIFNIFPRGFLYRLGRSMYMHARGEIENNMMTNGEMLIQKSVLNAFEKTSKNIVVFDVGANIGDWSKAILDQAKVKSLESQLELHIFEPVPATSKTLEINLENYKKHYLLNRLALSSEKGDADIFVVSENAGTNSLHDGGGSEFAGKISIKLTTAFDYCEVNEIHHVHLLKCDTEGHDMNVIRGALPLLKESRVSVLQFEYNHRWIYSRNYLRDVFQVVEGLPYQVAKVQGNHLVIIDRWNPELDRFFEGNYALIHENSVSWLPCVKASFNESNVLAVAEA